MILSFKSPLHIYTKIRIAAKKQNLEVCFTRIL